MTLTELRHAIRYLTRRPLFSLSISMSLALAIGSSTAVFSYVNFLLWQELPVHNPGDLVQLSTSESSTFSYPDFRALSENGSAFDALAAWAMFGTTLDAEDQTTYVYGQLTTGNFFTTLGVHAQAGRLLLAGDDRPGAQPVVVLSDPLWRRSFNADPQVVGHSILMNGHDFMIVGIAPRGFLGAGVPAALYVPISNHSLLRSPKTDWLGDPDSKWLSLIGRSPAGLGQAQAALDTFAKFYCEHRPLACPDGFRYHVTPAGTVVDVDTRRQLLPMARQLLLFVAMLVLLTCANTASLLLGHATVRFREIGVRTALGAGRGQLVRRLLMESLLLSLLGGLAGIGLALVGIRLIEGFLRATTAGSGGWAEGWAHLHLDLRVLLFVLGLCLATGLLSGLLPALFASSQRTLVSLLKDSPVSWGGSRGRRFNPKDSLIVVQIAVSVWLLAGTLLLGQSLRRLQLLDPGFETEKILLVGLAGPNDAATSSFQSSEAFPAASQAVEALPSVASASLSWTVPLSGWSRNTTVGRLESPDESLPVNLAIVGERYFETLSIPLLQGREFNELDDAAHPRVVIVNEAFAKRLWPGESPFGRLVVLPQIAGAAASSAFEVIGLVANTRQATVWEEPEPLVYLSLRQNPKRRVTLMIRTHGSPSSIAGSVRATLRDRQPDMAVVDLLPFTTHLRGALMTQHMNPRVISVLAVLGLILAALGVWSSMNSMVTQRTHEIGIRLTLGAEPKDASRLVIAQGFRLALPGIVLGIAFNLASLKLLAGLLEGAEVSPEPALFLASALSLLVVTYLACRLPAQRAAKVDPLVSIRS